jgi:hypothetical protein
VTEILLPKAISILPHEINKTAGITSVCKVGHRNGMLIARMEASDN